MYDQTISTNTKAEIERKTGGIVKLEPFSDTIYRHLLFNQHFNLTNITAKIDVEGAEWNGFLYCYSNWFDCVGQFVIELHDLNSNNLVEECLTRLLKRYTIFHIHANNHRERHGIIPDILEVSFVRNDLIQNKEKETVSYPLEGLDFPNNLQRTDYILDWWL
jgi:hypothetical protein